jgi:hypothetical protein
VIIHFQDDVELRDLIVLNHEWITKGVYKILDDSKVLDKKGRFNQSDIIRIWSSDDYKNKIKELLSLMKNHKFDLCFELGDGEYLVPRLLPVDEIEHDWITSEYNSRFEFRYKFMPKGILARLIVKMNSDIFKDMYWRYGVILESEGTISIIREKYFENKITIEINGPDKREFLYLIRKAINSIHHDFNKLAVSQMIPCNCPSCASNEEPHFYDFDLLKRYESNEIGKIRCEISLQEVPVYDLTSDVVRRALTQEKVVFCENKNSSLMNLLGFEKTTFFPERDSSSVFIKVSTKPDCYGLRDRDFLLDSEIEKIQKKYSNYFILDYYCFENYLYHPENLFELNLTGFAIENYIQDVIDQKNQMKNQIISNYKNARKSYQEFKIEADKLCDNKRNEEIINYLESDDVEVFFKAYSMKDKFNKENLKKYALKEKDLVSTDWFKKKMDRLFSFN